jgi:gamma-aminobutyric acid receptor subunit alpha
MTFLGLEARTSLPKVAYPTALDFFVFLSFSFIFATILQFAIVHYFTKYGSGECYFNFLEDSDESESEDEDAVYFQQSSTSHLSSLNHIDSADLYGVIPLSRFEIEFEDEKKSDAIKSLRKFMAKYFFCLSLSKSSEDETCPESDSGSIIQQLDSGASTVTQNTPQCRRHSTQPLKQPRGGYRRNFNSVSKVDKFSRVGFPMLFFVINLIYWIFYLSRSQRK